MRKLDKNTEVFFALLRAGLWEKDVQILPFGEIDLSVVQQLAEEQSVVGPIAIGLEHVTDTKMPKKDVLQFIGQTLQLEERNKAMNYFIGVIVDKMRDAGIFTTLVKGQGVAQCYERPLWRACGDVDFLLDEENYSKARAFLIPLAISTEVEEKGRLHQGMTIDPWVVELHGTMHTGISKRIDSEVDKVQQDILWNGGVRVWDNDGGKVFLPSPDNDVIIIFTHFIDHFYVGGIGLRQICDWCRLLWTYRSTIDVALLEKRVKAMGLMTEWKAFASFAVEYLGMPAEAMPMYSDSARYLRKAHRICRLIIMTGNFGHNKDESYRSRYPRMVGKVITFFRRLAEFIRITLIFPNNAPGFFLTYVGRRLNATL